MASYRHLARIAVMQTIFAYEFREDVKLDEALDHCIKEFSNKLKETDFAEKVAEGVFKHKEEIYKIIKEEAPEWPIDRIARVDRAILMIGIYEILYSEDVPAIVAINEGVEIAKSYGDMNSAKFINGVLSSVMHKHRPDSVNEKKPTEKVKNKRTTKTKTKTKESTDAK